MSRVTIKHNNALCSRLAWIVVVLFTTCRPSIAACPRFRCGSTVGIPGARHSGSIVSAGGSKSSSSPARTPGRSDARSRPCQKARKSNARRSISQAPLRIRQGVGNRGVSGRTAAFGRREARRKADRVGPAVGPCSRTRGRRDRCSRHRQEPRRSRHDSCSFGLAALGSGCGGFFSSSPRSAGRRDLPRAQLKNWFKSVPATMATTQVPLREGVRTQLHIKLPIAPRTEDRDFLEVSWMTAQAVFSGRKKSQSCSFTVRRAIRRLERHMSGYDTTHDLGARSPELASFPR